MNALFRLMTVVLLAGAAALSCSGAHAKGYAPVLTPSATGVAVAVRANADAAAVLSKVGSNVNVTSSIIANIARGVSVEAVVTGAVSGASVGGAWGAAVGAVGAVAIVAIPQIAEMMKKANVGVNSAGQFADVVPGCSANCVYYSFQGGPETSSFAAACQSGVGKGQSSGYGYQTWRSVVDAQPYGCKYQTDMFVTDYWALYSRQVAAYPDGPGAPITVQQAQAKITANAPTAADVQALIDANFPPEVAPLSITGPATVTGGNTVKLGLDGSSQTETCKFYLEYFPSNIKAHPECTTVTTIPERSESKTVTTTNPDGSTSSQLVTTTTPASSSTSVVTADKVKDADQVPTDSALSDVPVLYTPKYPLGLVGVWALQRAALVATPLANLASSLMPSVASSGSCPAMMVNLSFSSWANFGTHNVAPPCSIWDFGRIVILISALLLARRLIFGG